MSFIKIFVHAVWATKDRKPLMSIANKNALCEHIRQNSKVKNIHLLNINGVADHLHALISMSSDQNIATIMNLLKGESAYWANRNLQLEEKFGWQDEYFAVSISESHFSRVYDYISNQELHHSKKSFQQEYDDFIAKYQFEGLKP
jgi:putative transposase